jgi:hypothetical protein
MQIGKSQHEKELCQILNKMKSEGWKTVDLKAKSPDAVATKHGKLIAIEVLGVDKTKGKGYNHSWTYAGKKNLYERLGFDELKIFTFERSSADWQTDRLPHDPPVVGAKDNSSLSGQ